MSCAELFPAGYHLPEYKHHLYGFTPACANRNKLVAIRKFQQTATGPMVRRSSQKEETKDEESLEDPRNQRIGSTTL